MRGGGYVAAVGASTIDVSGTAPATERKERVTMKRLHSILRREDGAATAEYAIATMAAVGFAGLLVAILRSDEVRGMLTELVHRALTFAG
ncbi:hypothetical protein BH10ACT4_BH10ACT4_14020 [soil metagenome]